jgi:hypothetical protein
LKTTTQCHFPLNNFKDYQQSKQLALKEGSMYL